MDNCTVVAHGIDNNNDGCTCGVVVVVGEGHGGDGQHKGDGENNLRMDIANCEINDGGHRPINRGRGTRGREGGMIETCVRTYAADERAALTGRWAWGGGAGVSRF